MSEVLTERETQAVLHELEKQPDRLIAVDTETTSLHVGGDARTVGVSLAWYDGPEPVKRSIYLPFQHPAGTNFSPLTRDMLKWVLEDQPRRLVLANVQFDTLALEDLRISIERQDIYDVILMAHLIDENQPRSKSLEELCRHYVDADAAKVADPFIEKEKKSGWPSATYEQVWPYATVDAELTLELYQVLTHHPEFAKLPEGLWAHKQRFIATLLQMRRHGVRIDRRLSAAHAEEASMRMEQAKLSLGLGAKDNLGPKALNRLLHEELSIPVRHHTPGGKPAFDKAAMEDYERDLERLDSPLAEQLRIYRGWQKASTAASLPYLELMDSDGRLRCSYKMHGTATGRLSCEKPNLQQIPKSSDKPWNGQLKEMFIGEPGYTLVNADFSQLELRLGTAYAGDVQLKRVFAEGRDIFTEMAAQLGWPRQDVKTFVYSVSYGAGIRRIMSAFRVSADVAEEMRTAYFRQYPLFKVINDQVTRHAERHGYVTTWTGRKRRFPYRTDSYKAWNSLIQGGGADLMERCMIFCDDRLNTPDTRMLLQVHDSLTWEVRDDMVAEFMPVLKDTMEDVATYCRTNFDVKFAVDVDFWSAREEARHRVAVA